MIAKCNGQGPLLVLLQTDKGRVLGGYYPLKFQLSEDKGLCQREHVHYRGLYKAPMYQVSSW